MPFMLTPTTPAPSLRRFSLADQATALAIILKKEFGVPFAFYDAVKGQRVATKDQDQHGDPAVALDPDTVLSFAREGSATANLQPNGRFRLALPIYESGQTVLVASGELRALSHNVAEVAQEQLRTQRWLQAVGDRLRQADHYLSRHRDDGGQEAQVKSAWEAVLRLDHVIRRLRIHKEASKNHRRILQSAHELLAVQTLVWVPHNPEEPVVVQGEPLLSSWDFRQLSHRLAQAPEMQSSGLVLSNQVKSTSWGGRYPQIVNLMALRVNEQGSLGWIIAVNKEEPRSGLTSNETKQAKCPEVPTQFGFVHFRRSDAALLTPFVALVDLYARSSARYRDLQELLVGLARSLTSAIDAKDSYTYGHSERVARIAMELGRAVGLQEEELSDVFLAGLLHDIGKIGVRDAILSKVEPLTAEEFEHIKQHVTIGYSILQNLKPIAHLLPGVRNHHERYDGKGYPDGLAGEAIPLLARILAVADSYDAMTTNRPYREALPLPKVEEILKQGAGTQWDKRVIDAFLSCRQKIHGIRQRGVGDSLRHALDDALRRKDSGFAQSLVAF
jgi:putative nucleotidyltransferase with HDIG domain